MENKIVEVKNLSHRYGVDWVVKDINFEIRSKGIFGLLGSNGAGKSTIMNIICNVLTPSEGEILINGIDLREQPIQAKKFIGFLPQKAPLHPEMTVDEYLYHCAEIRLIPKARIPGAMEKVKEKCGIAHFKNRVIGNLSGGYQQRVGIAQAIIHDPKFVILDEPTNGLDPNQILEVRDLIRGIATERAVLVSTHILPEVRATCDYIIMIDHGQMVFKGSLNEFDHYLDPSVLLVIMYNAPQEDDAFLSIEGIERVERLTRTRVRLHFHEDRQIVKRVVERAVQQNWQLREIALEKESLDKVFAKLSGKF